MTQQYTPNLGGEPAADARRDAVHVAVAPVKAGVYPLRPGDRVGLSAQTGRAVPVEDSDTGYIGVVDPYLDGPPLLDQLFWLFLRPNTVTSLRHVWTHPAFAVRPPAATANA